MNDGARRKIAGASQAIMTFCIKSPLSRGKGAKQHWTGTAVLTDPDDIDEQQIVKNLQSIK